MTDTPSWPRRVWRRLYWWRRDRDVRLRYAGISHAIYFGGQGIGDELLCSVPLHELRRRGATGIGMLTYHPELFHRSPDVDVVRPMDYRDLAFFSAAGIRGSQVTYIHEQRPPDIDVPPTGHILGEMCRRCGVSGEVELRPRLWLSDAERAAAAPFADCVIVQSSRQSASLQIGNKEWVAGRFQEVVSGLPRSRRIIQVGLRGDPPLEGAEDFRGKLPIREIAAALSVAGTFVGLVGLLMHLARSVECPAVIIYGGRERPDQSGYSCNENLYTAVPCAPCWRWNTCDFEHRCMTAIEPAQVLEAVGRILARNRGPLAIDRAVLV